MFFFQICLILPARVKSSGSWLYDVLDQQCLAVTSAHTIHISLLVKSSSLIQTRTTALFTFAAGTEFFILFAL